MSSIYDACKTLGIRPGGFSYGTVHIVSVSRKCPSCGWDYMYLALGEKPIEYCDNRECSYARAFTKKEQEAARELERGLRNVGQA